MASRGAAAPASGEWPLLDVEKPYRYLNPETMQALFFFSEDTKADALAECAPAPPPPARRAARRLTRRAAGRGVLARQINLRGTGHLFRLFNTAVNREENVDPD